MRVVLASDHAGFDLKAPVAEQIQQLGHELLDLGAHQIDPEDDYPDYARYVGQAIQSEQAARGVLLCGSGVGACVAVNKLKGVRAGMCHDSYSARQGVEHDHVNVLCLGARIVGTALGQDLVRVFLTAGFSGEPRHERRLKKIQAIEQAWVKG